MNPFGYDDTLMTVILISVILITGKGK